MMGVLIDYKTIINQYVLGYLFFYLATDLFQSIAYYFIPQISFVSSFFISISLLLSALVDFLLIKQHNSCITSAVSIENKKGLSPQGNFSFAYGFILKVLWLSLLNVTHHLLIGFSNYPSYISILQCYQIVFIALLHKIRLKTVFGTKQAIGLLIVLIGILIGSLIKVEESLMDRCALYIVFSSLCFSIKCVEEKVLLDQNAISPHNLLLLEGVFSLGLYFLFCYVALNIPCGDSWLICPQYNALFNFSRAMRELFSAQLINGIVMIVFCLLYIGRNIQMLKLNSQMSPLHIGIIDSLFNYLNSFAVLIMHIFAYYAISLSVLFMVLMVSLALMTLGCAFYIECIRFNISDVSSLSKKKSDKNVVNGDESKLKRMLKKKGANERKALIEFPLIESQAEEETLVKDENEKEKEENGNCNSEDNNTDYDNSNCNSIRNNKGNGQIKGQYNNVSVNNYINNKKQL